MARGSCEDERACLQTTCSDATKDESTIGSCFKEKCKSAEGDAARIELYGQPAAKPADTEPADDKPADDKPAEPTTDSK